MLSRYWPLTCLAFSGCILDIGKCNYENRHLELAGALTGSAQQPGTSPANAEVFLAEVSEGVYPRTLSAYVHIPSAVAISLVQLRQTTPSGSKVLFSFPPGGAMGADWSANVDLSSDTLSFEALAFQAKNGFLTLYVQVGVQGNLGDLSGKVRVRSLENWNRAYCD